MCTNFQITAQDGAVVVGRSMEFDLDVAPSFYVHGRNARCQALDHEALSGIWGRSSRYGYVGVSIQVSVAGKLLRPPGVADGLNEHGLTAGMLWMPGSKYQTVTAPDRRMPVTLFIDLILGQCRDIPEVLALLPQYDFWLPDIIATDLPLHFPITDAAGRSIVVEFQNGEQRIHANRAGVCTNAPWFPWQETNLSNYVQLTPHDPEAQSFGALTLSAPGAGAGLAGLPGNATPPARFVRAFLFQRIRNPTCSTGHRCRRSESGYPHPQHRGHSPRHGANRGQQS